jgi:hypothetical protein
MHFHHDDLENSFIKNADLFITYFCSRQTANSISVMAKERMKINYEKEKRIISNETDS